MMRKVWCGLALFLMATVTSAWWSPSTAWAQDTFFLPQLSFGVTSPDNPEQVAVTLQVLGLLTVLSLAPAILMLMTSFTRVVVVLSFVRSGMATNQLPPNQVIVGLALFLTLFTMSPVLTEVRDQAWNPYQAGLISQTEALARAQGPIREFMLAQTRESDLALFVDMSGQARPDSPDELGLSTIIPAFVISELKTAFQIGFMIFIPFIIIDMVVASTLMSMGMLMLPPAMISLPFKILLFVLVDGWRLVVQSLLLSFQ